jgi:2-polyprenyl-3-methyl-5-hydroxy-6-metoxy-1,4-benzoquinol methylase
MNARELSQHDLGFQENLYRDSNPTRSWLHNTRRDWVLDALDRHTPKRNESVLEIGVGCGTFTRHLSGRGCRVMAVDINADFLNAVALLPRVSVSRADASAPLRLTGYDLVLCSEVLEHIEPSKSPTMLRNIHTALKPHGVLVLTTPQPCSTVEIAARLLRFHALLALARRIYGSVDELGHINLLAPATLRRQLENLGFEILENTRRGLYIPVLAEFCGPPGQAAQAALERVLQNVPLLSGLLWTQCYVLCKSG